MKTTNSKIAVVTVLGLMTMLLMVAPVRANTAVQAGYVVSDLSATLVWQCPGCSGSDAATLSNQWGTLIYVTSNRSVVLKLQFLSDDARLQGNLTAVAERTLDTTKSAAHGTWQIERNGKAIWEGEYSGKFIEDDGSSSYVHMVGSGVGEYEGKLIRLDSRDMVAFSGCILQPR